MASQQTFVIVGAGLAGAKAAETMREEGFDGRVVLVGDELERPYERPPLSKDYLRGESPREKAYVHPAGLYRDQEIELRTGTAAIALDASARELELAGGERLGYDALLLATGAEPRRLPLPGAELEGVLYLRTFADCDALRERLGAGGRLAVIGAGWIGSEVAASARQLGLEVDLIERTEVPLEGVLGAEAGALWRDLHVQHGVRFHGGAKVAAIEGAGRAERVRLEDGSAIDCDLVVVGVGVRPRTELAEAAGLEVENGVVVDERLETSAPGVFACGDLANAWHPLLGARIRVEHWANALNGGPAAARNMLGKAIPYERLPYFFSDQYEVGMEYSGYAADWDRVVLRGEPDRHEYIAFWLSGGRVLAGMNVNVWDVTDPIQALIRSGAIVDPDRLADPAVPLEALAGPSQAA